MVFLAWWCAHNHYISASLKDPQLITPEIRAHLDRVRLGFVATASPDGLPNVSPKGTIIPWGDGLAFADINSPNTVRNIRLNSRIEINTVDPILRKGFRFRGEAEVCHTGDAFSEIISHYRKAGIRSPIRAVILVRVQSVSRLVSPLYDLGMTEDEVQDIWRRRYIEP